jgi:hypothetical protein
MPYDLFHRIDSVEPDTYTMIFWGPPAGEHGERVMYWTPDGLRTEASLTRE